MTAYACGAIGRDSLATWHLVLQKEPRVEGGGSISVFRAVRSEDVFLELATRRQFKVLLWQVILIQTLVWLID